MRRTTDHSKLAIAVGFVQRHGTKRIEAEVVEPRTDGPYRRSWNGIGGWENGAEHAGLLIGCYIDYDGPDRRDLRGVWGTTITYKECDIEYPEHARQIARILDKLRKGLERLDRESGHLPDADFGAYLARVASILGIKQILVRNSKTAEANLAPRWRQVDGGSGLQLWVSTVVQDIRHGKTHEHKR